MSKTKTTKSTNKPSTKRLSDDEVWQIARVMHEAVRAWQMANTQSPAPPWSRAPKWMKTASYDAVNWRVENAGAPASTQHKQWMSQKTKEGWRYGKTKNATRKTHPLMVPYTKLPEVERRKDALVAAIIDSLTTKMR